MELTVKAHERVRLDVYLREALVWKSRRRIQGLIRTGNILVNGRAAKPSQGVRGGDRVEVRLSMGTGIPQDYLRREVAVIYEDPWILAVDKPPGLLVHPVGRHVYDTLMNYLHFRYLPREGEARPVRPDRHASEIDESISPRLCHRIDKDTTGIILVAKESYVHQRMQWQFQHRRVSKEYHALVAGRVPADLEEIKLPIGEGRDLAEALLPPLRPAHTLVKTLETFEGPSGSFSLLAARPVTGRQNQIRVHLAAIGHPIAGDRRYGGPSLPGFPSRYLLHARSIRFDHPRRKCPVLLEADLPADFLALVTDLRGEAAPVEIRPAQG
jgi:23S rRNA pseudouridine1911/1915/1917 synthase